MVKKLKCWRKIKTRDPKRLWKRGSKEVEVQFRKIKDMGYRSCINDKCKYFKTKSNALKKAEEYMKKHDKC